MSNAGSAGRMSNAGILLGLFRFIVVLQGPIDAHPLDGERGPT
jgi:hypothetical protein